MSATTVKRFNKKPVAALLLAAVLALLPVYKSFSAHKLTISQPSTVAKPDAMPNDQAFTYNFSSLPNGAVPSADFNIETDYSGFNGEQQIYRNNPQNLRIENGALVIEALPQQYKDKSYTSARLNTKGKYSFEYGTLEVDAMLPSGNGTWPAAWLMPAGAKYSPQKFGIVDNDPYAWVLNGEVDFMEEIGRQPGQNIPAAHSYDSRKSGIPQYTPAFVANASTTYHRYGVTKTPDKITYTIDGVPYATREKTSDSPLDWPYNQPYYLILNLAIGGDWAGASGIDNSTAPWELKIKSISYKPL